MDNRFDSQLREYASLVEAALEKAVTHKGLPYQSLLDAMGYSLLSGGKRIRGAMVLAFARLYGEDYQKALPFAAALEMIHAYSLIHDDLPCMDDDDLRRGKPSCHIAYGESTALLAGDGLLTLAFETAAGCDGYEPAGTLAAVGCLARAAGAHGMVGGQVLDLANEDKTLSVEELDRINRLKTGALFRACAEIPGLLWGADRERIDSGILYADRVGIAFQIVDDILDVTADAKTLGKPVGSDADNHKNTYAALHGVDRCRERVAQLNREAKAALEAFDGDVWFLSELADVLGGRQK